jgi:hypothetical protein
VDPLRRRGQIVRLTIWMEKDGCSRTNLEQAFFLMLSHFWAFVFLKQVILDIFIKRHFMQILKVDCTQP